MSVQYLLSPSTFTLWWIGTCEIVAIEDGQKLKYDMELAEHNQGSKSNQESSLFIPGNQSKYHLCKATCQFQLHYACVALAFYPTFFRKHKI